jgi:Spy/CpxP family protein refolding chaperone
MANDRPITHRNLGARVAACVVAALLPAIVMGEPPPKPHGPEGPAASPRRPLIPGYAPESLAALDLTPEQRAKMTEIERDLKRKQWSLLGSLRELRWKQEDVFRKPEVDAAEARRTYDAMAAVRKDMFAAALDARKKMEGVLTAEQRSRVARPAAERNREGG